MNDEYVILDASSLIALLCNENGCEVVASVVSKAIISTVNLSEVAKFLIEHRKMTKKEAITAIKGLVTAVVDFDEKQAFDSAELITQTKSLGLSFSDRACIALGLQTGYTLYTSDKKWSNLDCGCRIIQIR